MNNELLKGMLGISVPLHIHSLEEKGGPTDEDMKKAQEFSSVLGERGDILLFGGGKKGECAEMFNRAAFCIAVLAITCPGGISIFGLHFEAKKGAK